MQIRLEEPLSRHGYWRVGGRLDRLVLVEAEEELPDLLSAGPWQVLGNGSNLLAPDEGLRGTTIRLGLRDFEVLSDDGEHVRVRVGAGLLNVVLLGRVGRLGLGGIGALAGVPGTVGGAVVMNAGTALGEVESFLEAVEGWTAEGKIILEREQLPMHYREGGVPERMVVTAAILRLRRTGFAEEQVKIGHHLARRKATQPLELPSCGSVFRNPPGDAAGRLIEAAGLKGHAIGKAAISERHGNFIVNRGGASASEVMGCIRLAWEEVRARFGVTLIPEVRVLGEWPAGVWPLG